MARNDNNDTSTDVATTTQAPTNEQANGDNWGDFGGTESGYAGDEWNWAGQKEWTGFEVKKAGPYPFVVRDAEFRYSESSNNPMIAMRLRFRDGDSSFTVPYYLTFDEESMQTGRAWATLRRIWPEVPQNFTPPRDAGKLINRTGMALVGVQKARGDNPERNTVREILPPDSAGGAGGAFSFS